MNLVLTGLSGSGKTTLGKRLAITLDMDFLDMDAKIEEEAGMPIGEIFARYGEARFRQMEEAEARKAAFRENTVIAAGGGAVMRENTITHLRSGGLIFFLDRPPEAIARDITLENRPLLKAGAERIFEMSGQRRGRYLASADFILANTGTEEEALAALLRLVEAETKGYAVIGDPIAHSLSPLIHEAVCAASGAPVRYGKLHVRPGELEAFMRQARLRELRGFNVTAPHKRDITPLLDEVEEEALLCGAVNTVVARDGRFFGANTDMEGLLLSLRYYGYGYRNNHVVILGTGGAASGIALKALREKAETITLLGRRLEAGKEIASRFASVPGADRIRCGDLSRESLLRAAEGCGLLISTIPWQTGADTSFLGSLPRNALVYDILYDPPLTALLAAARGHGLAAANGLGMLIYQAILADELYLGRPLDREGLYQTALNQIKQSGREVIL